MTEVTGAQPTASAARWRRIADSVFDRAPLITAALAFLAGAVSLLSAANPEPLLKPAGLFGHLLDEWPNIAEAGAGVAFMALAVGLRRRMRNAWWVCLLLAVHGLVLSLYFHGHPPEIILHLGLAGFLLASKNAFYRRSGLEQIRFTRRWFAAVGGVFFCAVVGAALWAGHRTDFEAAPWWALVTDPMMGKAGRAVAVAGGVLALLAFIRFVAKPAPLQLTPPGDEDFVKVADILTHAEGPRPDAVLAYSGDKSFLFTPEKDAFLMYASSGGGLISMGGPVGPKAKWRPLLAMFRDHAAREGVRPAVYAAPPELLPDLLDLGFRVEKIGENAILDLPDFTLSGRKREVIRRGRRKLAERQGASFTLHLPPHDEALLDRLSPTSTAWLEDQNGDEKAFSLGKFDPDFLNTCPIGVVEREGEVIAFGSLWTTPDKGWAAIDLMRYHPERSPTNTMDFLLVELILWAKEQGYKKFDLAMAPLSGLAEGDHAPLFARLGRMIYEHGERIYNFRGLKRFKQKFDPWWEPRYLAAPGPWSLPVILAEAAVLTNGMPSVSKGKNGKTSSNGRG